MSERTVIGGVSYEAIGSSNANLLLKCNGTARILWGSKLIDLIKDGKIALSELQELIFIVLDESQITNDGIYIMQDEDSVKVLLCKDTQTYDLLGTDLYISASKELNITVEQKKQALKNIGIYFNSLDEALTSGVENGVVYIVDSKALYLVRDGIASEISINKNSVTVENELEKDKNDINSSDLLVVSDSSIPSGVITMFNNDTSIPAGWAVCDGSNYDYNGINGTTPNLQHLFIEKTEEKTETTSGLELGESTEEPDNSSTLVSNYSVIYIMKL